MEHVTEDCNCSGKWCRKCQRMLCVGEYTKDKRLKSGLKSQCRTCAHAEGKQWRENNREYDAARHRAERRAHPEHVRARENAYLETHREHKNALRRQRYRDNVDGFGDRMRRFSSKYRFLHPRSISRPHKEKRSKEDLARRSLQYYYANREVSQERWRRYYESNKLRMHQRVYQWRKDNPSGHAAINNRRRTRKTQAGGLYTIAEWETLKSQCDYTCLRCGRREPAIKLTADHVIPVALLGSSDIANIQPLCGSCNSWKANKIIDFRPKKA